MPYSLKIYSAEDVSPAEREQAAQRFRAALDTTLGDASLVLPVYRAWRKLQLVWGEHGRPWPISESEQLLVDQWEAAELAATQAAFGVDRYMGDADFELGDATHHHP